MFDKDEKLDIKTFFSKEELKSEQPKEEKPKPEQPEGEDKPSGGYEGRRRNKVCNDGKDWKDFH
tara:strand:+ start:1133 stop:1324 length:192 start_codon:yes stop_codon:yes gene_type:complete